MTIAFVLTKFLYIFQIILLLCGIHSMERQIASFNAAILVVICFTCRIIILFQTLVHIRRLLRNQNIQVPAVLAPNNNPSENNQEDENEQEKMPQTNVQPCLGDGTAPRRNCSLIRHREMESEAINYLAELSFRSNDPFNSFLSYSHICGLNERLLGHLHQPNV